MKVRPAKPSDAPSVRSAQYYAHKISYRGYLPDDYLDSIALDNAAIECTAQKIQETEYYVAEKDKKVIGFANLCYPEEKTVEVQTFYVHPDFQRQGAGSALLNKICKIKKKAGYTKLVVWTIKNGPSLGFYHKKGFQPSSVPEKNMALYKPWNFDVPIIRLEKDL